MSAKSVQNTSTHRHSIFFVRHFDRGNTNRAWYSSYNNRDYTLLRIQYRSDVIKSKPICRFLDWLDAQSIGRSFRSKILSSFWSIGLNRATRVSEIAFRRWSSTNDFLLTSLFSATLQLNLSLFVKYFLTDFEASFLQIIVIGIDQNATTIGKNRQSTWSSTFMLTYSASSLRKYWLSSVRGKSL